MYLVLKLNKETNRVLSYSPLQSDVDMQGHCILVHSVFDVINKGPTDIDRNFIPVDNGRRRVVAKHVRLSSHYPSIQLPFQFDHETGLLPGA